MFKFRKSCSRASQTEVICGCVSEVRCNKNASTQIPEEGNFRRPLSSIDFITVPHRQRKTSNKVDQIIQVPEDNFSEGISLSAQGSSLEGEFGSEEERDFDDLVEKFAKLPLKSEYYPPKSKKQWPAFKTE